MSKIVTGSELVSLIGKYASGVKHVWLVSPFLSEYALFKVLEVLSLKEQINLTVITKWEPIDLLLGYSEISAFKMIYSKMKFKKWNVKVFIANTLHAKVFMLGKKLAVVGSMNLTNAGFATNIEIGVALAKGDSKLATLEKKLFQIRKCSYELTKEAFDWRVEKELPQFENKAKALKALKAALNRQKEAGLQSFVPENKNQEEISYFGGVIRVLKWVSSRNPTWDELKAWLDKIAVKGGGQISQTRLDFLLRLGLLYGDRTLARVTPLGNEIARTGSSERFVEVLFGSYPDFEKLRRALIGDYKHPGEIAKELGYGGAQYWALRLRWLVSLGEAEVIIEKKKKYYRLKERGNLNGISN